MVPDKCDLICENPYLLDLYIHSQRDLLDQNILDFGSDTLAAEWQPLYLNKHTGNEHLID